MLYLKCFQTLRVTSSCSRLIYRENGPEQKPGRTEVQVQKDRDEISKMLAADHPDVAKAIDGTNWQIMDKSITFGNAVILRLNEQEVKNKLPDEVRAYFKRNHMRIPGIRLETDSKTILKVNPDYMVDINLDSNFSKYNSRAFNRQTLVDIEGAYLRLLTEAIAIYGSSESYYEQLCKGTGFSFNEEGLTNPGAKNSLNQRERQNADKLGIGNDITILLSPDQRHIRGIALRGSDLEKDPISEAFIGKEITKEVLVDIHYEIGNALSRRILPEKANQVLKLKEKYPKVEEIVRGTEWMLIWEESERRSHPLPVIKLGDHFMDQMPPEVKSYFLSHNVAFPKVYLAIDYPTMTTEVPVIGQGGYEYIGLLSKAISTDEQFYKIAFNRPFTRQSLRNIENWVIQKCSEYVALDSEKSEFFRQLEKGTGFYLYAHGEMEYRMKMKDIPSALDASTREYGVPEIHVEISENRAVKSAELSMYNFGVDKVHVVSMPKFEGKELTAKVLNEMKKAAERIWKNVAHEVKREADPEEN